MFSTPQTCQHNRVVDMKNGPLSQLARTMLNETNFPKYFLTNALNAIL